MKKSVFQVSILIVLGFLPTSVMADFDFTCIASYEVAPNTKETFNLSGSIVGDQIEVKFSEMKNCSVANCQPGTLTAQDFGGDLLDTGASLKGHVVEEDLVGRIAYLDTTGLEPIEGVAIMFNDYSDDEYSTSYSLFLVDSPQPEKSKEAVLDCTLSQK